MKNEIILSEPMSLQRVKLQVILDNSSICPWLPSSFISTCLLIHSIAPSPDLLELRTMMVEIIQPSIKSQYCKKLVNSPASIEKKDLEKFWQRKEGENLLIKRALYKILFLNCAANCTCTKRIENVPMASDGFGEYLLFSCPYKGFLTVTAMSHSPPVPWLLL